MGTQVQTTTDYGALFRPRVKTEAEKRQAAAVARARGGGGNTAVQNNAPSAGDQSERGDAYGVSAPRTFKAREKNADYKDHIDQIRQLRALATPSEDRGVLIFPSSELAKKFKNFKALANEYEVNNQQCDAGNGQSCMLAGRGQNPTDYPSPFSDSAHYNANSYFGMGDGSAVERQQVRAGDGVAQASGSGSGDGSTESTQDRVMRERNEAEDARIAKENANGEPARPAMPPGMPEVPEVIEPSNGAERTGEGTSIFKPKHNNDHHDPISGGGSHSGSDGSASHENEGVHDFTGGGGIKRSAGYEANERVKQYLTNIQALKNPYGHYSTAGCGKRRYVE